MNSFGYNIEARRRFRVEFFDQKNLIDAPEIIFDVGGHTGETVSRYREIYRNSTIYSFEPFRDAYDKLVLRHKIDKLVIPINIAISDSENQTSFYVNKASETNSLFPPQNVEERPYHEHDENYSETKKIEIGATTIDSFCKKNNIKNIDILKMDIQGGELKALSGAREMLSEKKIGLIYTEVNFVRIYKNQPLFHNICEYLEKFGYLLSNVYYLSPAKSGQLIAADALFLKSNN